MFLVVIGERLHQICPDDSRSGANSDTGSLILCRTLESTFEFLCVTFRDSPSLRSSHFLTKDVDSVDSPRPIHYSTSDRRVPREPAFSPRFSLTQVHRYIGPRNVTSPVSQPVRLMYPSASDSPCEPVPSPSPRSSITQTNRCIGPHNVTTSLTHAHRCIGDSVSSNFTSLSR